MDNGKSGPDECKNLKADIARAGALGTHEGRVVQRAVKDSDIGRKGNSPTENQTRIFSVATAVVSVFHDILLFSRRVWSPAPSVRNDQRPRHYHRPEQRSEADSDQASTFHDYSRNLVEDSGSRDRGLKQRDGTSILIYAVLQGCNQ